jgi:hypothetical protein
MNQLIKRPCTGEIIGPDEGVWVVGRQRPFEAAGSRIKLPAGLTVAELLDAAINRRSVMAEYVVYIDGIPVPQHMHDKVRVKGGHTVTYAPHLKGANARSIASLGLAVAALVLSVVLPPLVGPLIAGLIGAGVVVGGGLLINALFPVAPQTTLQDQRKGIETAFSISGSSNVADPFGPVPLIFGRVRVWPRYGARPYVIFKGDGKQVLKMLLVVGYGPLDISDVRIGETPIDDFDDVQINIFESFDSETDELGIFYQQTFQELLNIELTEDAGFQTRVTAMGVDEIKVSISHPNGWYEIDNEGNLQGREIEFEADYRIFNSGDPWSSLEHFHDNNYKSKRNHVFGLTVDGLPPEQYEVRVRKQSNDDNDTDVVEDLFWIALTAFRSSDPIQFAKPLTVIEVSVKATGQLSGVIDSLNCMAEARVTAFNGSSWVEDTTSRNPADAFRWALQGPGINEPVPDDEINLTSLEQWHSYCEDNGFEFNLEHSKRASVFDTLRMIAATGKARVTRTDGLWGVIWDALDVPVAQHFTPRNSWGFQEQRVYFELPHALRVNFINEELGYTADELRIYQDGFTAANATKFEAAEFPGVTSEVQIETLAEFQMAQAVERPSTYTLTTNWQSLSCTTGDKVYCAHDSILIGLVQGRVVNVVGGLVTLDELVLFEAATSYAMRFRQSDGTSVIRDIDTQPPGYSDEFQLTSSALANPSVGDLAMVGESVPGPAQIFRVRDIEWLPDLTARLSLVDDMAPIAAGCNIGNVPDGAYAYADFVNGCYWIDGEEVTLEDWLTDPFAFGFTSGEIEPGLGWSGAYATYPTLGPTIASDITNGATIVIDGDFSENLSLLEVTPYQYPDFNTFWDFQYGSSGAGYNVIELDDNATALVQINPTTAVSLGERKIAFSYMWSDPAKFDLGWAFYAATDLPFVGSIANQTGTDPFTTTDIGWDDADGYIRTITIYSTPLKPGQVELLVDNAAPTPDATAAVYADFKYGIFKIDNVDVNISFIFDDSSDTGTWGSWTSTDYYTQYEGVTDWGANNLAIALAGNPWGDVKDGFTMILDYRSEDISSLYMPVLNQPGSNFQNDLNLTVSSNAVEVSSSPTLADASALTLSSSLAGGGFLHRIGWNHTRSNKQYSGVAIRAFPDLLALPADQLALSPYQSTQINTTEPGSSAYDEVLFQLEFGSVLERLIIYTPQKTPTELVALVDCAPPTPQAEFTVNALTNVDLSSGVIQSWDPNDYFNNHSYGDSETLDRNQPTRMLVPTGYTYTRATACAILTNVTAGSEVTLTLLKNGTEIVSRREAVTLTTIASHVCSPLLPTATGDYFQLKVSSGADTSVSAAVNAIGMSLEFKPLPAPPVTPLGPIEAFSGALLTMSGDATAVNATAGYTPSFDTESYDVGGWHAGGNPTRLTVPSGVSWAKFSFNASISSGTASECHKAYITKNGSQAYAGCPIDTYEGGTASRLGVHTPWIPVTTGDYFEAGISVEADSSVTLDALGTMFGAEAYATPDQTFLGLTGAMVYKAADQTAANFTTATALTWDSEHWDRFSRHSTSSNTSRIIAPYGGWYRATACIYIDLINNNEVKAFFRVNGSAAFPDSQSQNQVTQTTKQVFVTSPLMPMAQNQYVEVVLLVQTDTSVTIQGGANKSWFALEYVPTVDIDGDYRTD